MTQPSNNYFRAVLIGSLPGGEVWNCSLWYNNLNGYTDENAVAEGVRSTFVSLFWSQSTNPWASRVSNACTFDRVQTFHYDGPNLIAEGASTGASTPGTGGTAPSPNYSAAVFTLLTGEFGRSKRGRIYLPYTTSVSNTNGQLVVVLGHAQNLATFLRQSTFTGATGPVVPSVFSRHLNILTPISGVRLDTKPDTQRGRNASLSNVQRFVAAI